MTQSPWDAAMLRGARIKRILVQSAGGTLSALELAAHLGITEEAVNARRESGKIFWLPAGQGHVYPAFQIGADGLLSGIPEVLMALADPDPWVKTHFMLSPDSRLGGACPIEELRAGRVDQVIRAARNLGTHGA